MCVNLYIQMYLLFITKKACQQTNDKQDPHGSFSQAIYFIEWPMHHFVIKH